MDGREIEEINRLNIRFLDLWSSIKCRCVNKRKQTCTDEAFRHTSVNIYKSVPQHTNHM